ncbi:MAG: histidine kinase [Aeromicrobium erythreum]
MVLDALRSLWSEPRPAGARGPGRRDVLLASVLLTWSAGELLLRTGLAPVPLLLVVTAAVVAPLPWRRTHPLAACLVAFGCLVAVDALRLLTDESGTLLNSVAGTLLITHALFRWGAGREVVAGAVVITTWLPITTVADPTGWADTVGTYAFFLVAASVGVALRHHAAIRGRDVERARAREREQLARDLHDVVAHHVSGIAIQAQAGRAVALRRPDRAAEALETIEDAATRTLAELRSIVGVLRTGPQETDRLPQPTVADVHRLATDDRDRPVVTVSLTGDLADLPPVVGAAVFRLAQESVTNARRHARQATRVDVRVEGRPDAVRLTVDDDGSTGGGRPGAGYGLIGMQERTTLLGGAFRAGPRADHGWRVEATVPRTRETR